MDVQRLVAMANDIAAFFDADSGSAAPEGVRQHLRKFWEPRMRREIIEYLHKGGGGLCPTATAAIEKLAADPSAS